MNTPEVSKSAHKVSRKIDFFSLVMLMAAIGLALFDHFMLNEWAEATTLNHLLEHVLIFTAGMIAGGSVINLYRKARK